MFRRRGGLTNFEIAMGITVGFGAAIYNNYPTMQANRSALLTTNAPTEPNVPASTTATNAKQSTAEATTSKESVNNHKWKMCYYQRIECFRTDAASRDQDVSSSSIQAPQTLRLSEKRLQRLYHIAFWLLEIKTIFREKKNKYLEF